MDMSSIGIYALQIAGWLIAFLFGWVPAVIAFLVWVGYRNMVAAVVIYVIGLFLLGKNGKTGIVTRKMFR